MENRFPPPKAYLKIKDLLLSKWNNLYILVLCPSLSVPQDFVGSQAELCWQVKLWNNDTANLCHDGARMVIKGRNHFCLPALWEAGLKYDCWGPCIFSLKSFKLFDYPNLIIISCLQDLMRARMIDAFVQMGRIDGRGSRGLSVNLLVICANIKAQLVTFQPVPHLLPFSC